MREVSGVTVFGQNNDQPARSRHIHGDLYVHRGIKLTRNKRRVCMSAATQINTRSLKWQQPRPEPTPTKGHDGAPEFGISAT